VEYLNLKGLSRIPNNNGVKTVAITNATKKRFIFNKYLFLIQKKLCPIAARPIMEIKVLKLKLNK